MLIKENGVSKFFFEVLKLHYLNILLLYPIFLILFSRHLSHQIYLSIHQPTLLSLNPGHSLSKVTALYYLPSLWTRRGNYTGYAPERELELMWQSYRAMCQESGGGGSGGRFGCRGRGRRRERWCREEGVGVGVGVGVGCSGEG